jgi:hypothetical protein
MVSKIGFFKYENLMSKNSFDLPYYPIDESILKSVKHFKYEMENELPKKINGKYVVLI